MDKIAILFNPSAGKGKAFRKKTQLESLLRRWKIPYDLHITASEDHLKELTRKCLGRYSVLAGAGGDSTFDLMIDEIMAADAQVHLALIGLGSSNDIPREFDVENLNAACAALKRGRTRPVDLGCLVDQGKILRYFIGQATIGLGVSVNRYVEDLSSRRPRLAKLQGVAGGLGIIHSYRRQLVPVPLTIETEEGKREGSYVVANFSNIRYWATGKMLTPDAQSDDGRLDCCLIAACSFLRLAQLAFLARRGRHRRAAEVSFLSGKNFSIISERGFSVQVDGEIIGGSRAPNAFREIQVRVVPRALKLIY